MIFVISGPSAVGKDTVVRGVTTADPLLRISRSCTTRPRKEGEVDGVHYDFVTPQKFRHMMDRGEFLEWAKVHGNFYGTPRREVETDDGRDVILVIDCQGAKAVKRKIVSATTIFILPPSWRELERRLRGRGRESEDEVVFRLRNAVREITRASCFDAWIANGDLECSVKELHTLIWTVRIGGTPNERLGRDSALLRRVQDTLPVAVFR